MSRGKSPKLNLSSLRGNPSRTAVDGGMGLQGGGSPLSTSPPSSCVSSEGEQGLQCSNSQEATSSMVLSGCPRCLMYVMLSEDDRRCPKCKSTVLLDFLHDNSNTKKTTNG